MTWTNPTDGEIRAVLAACRHIAVVGLSPNPARDSHRVAAAMQQRGYDIIGVNPGQATILGAPCFDAIPAIPAGRPIDMVDLFRRSSEVGRHVDEAVARGGIACVWMQLGVIDEAAAWRARQAGLTVVMDRCLLVEHRRLLGS